MVYSARSFLLVVIVLKVLIVVLLIGVVISLFSGLAFLFKDTGREDSKRTLYALGVRVTLATALVLTVSYGFYTGELKIGSNAPWHNAIHDNPTQKRQADQPTSPTD